MCFSVMCRFSLFITSRHMFPLVPFSEHSFEHSIFLHDIFCSEIMGEMPHTFQCFYMQSLLCDDKDFVFALNSSCCRLHRLFSLKLLFVYSINPTLGSAPIGMF